MKPLMYPRLVLFATLFCLINAFSFVQAYAQNECSTAVALTSSTGCNNTNINLSSATASAGIPLGCAAAGTYNDYWYLFTAASTSHTITLSNIGARITAPRIQLYSGTCGSLTSVACSSSPHTSLTQTGLTIGATYYVRISQYGAFGGAGNYKIDVCLTHPMPPPSNDDCGGSTLLTSSTSCTNTSSTLYYATSSTGTIPTGCSISGTVYEVWFRFVATATSQSVSLSSLGTGLSSSTTYVQMFSSSTGLCGGTLTSLGCSAASSPLSVSSLTIGTTYYVRVFVASSPVGISSAAYSFNICVQQSGGNDLCANAIQLTSSTTCNTVSGTLNGATASGSLYGGSCGVTTAADVWYSFVAQSTNPTIVFTNNGIPRNSSNRAVIQLLSGDCSTLASVSCASRNDAFGTAYNHTTSGLTIGQTYYIRIFSNQTTTPSSTWTFSLCVTDAASDYAVETAKSYVNITKQNGGGSIDIGDVLEIRTTLSLTGTSTIDSLSFHDTLKAGAGFAFQTGSLAMRTNEGKIYGSAYTDATGDDAGFAVGSGAGTDTIIRINFGANATSASGGSAVATTSRPRTAAGNYLIMATYRVVVNGIEGKRINFGGGSFRYREQSTGTFRTVTFSRDSLIVYASPSVCPNAVSATNVIGDEFNGTFGAATGTSQQNRTPSANTNYVYRTFTSGTPNDNFYGITNNTASTGTVTDRTLPIPTANTNRVFGVWDISGDHTGAADEARGNPPCDASQPVSPTNPCGYMMVFNAAYKTDTAFQFNVANACPNTYYEVSAWFKNVCYKCGQDSAGRGQWITGGTYIPTAVNDTTGVKPNIAIKVNNLDYYNTGDIRHQAAGVSRMSVTADTANQWVKRAFVYKTDETTTNFTLTLRNNAPGGGGNDWAIDDISFKTCSPSMQMTPNSSQTFCTNSQVDMRVFIESYYNMYQYYQWERSTDGGNTWGTAPEMTGTQTFSYTNMGSSYRDTVAYPSIIANTTTNGYRYRIRVATTASGLSNSCAVFNTDDVIVVNLASSGCAVLPAELLKFNVELNGDKSLLTWKTKDESLKGYEVERSNDGVHFSYIGFVSAKGMNGNETSYLFNDPVAVTGKVYYRLKMVSFATENNKYSNTLLVTLNPDHHFEITNLVNPFISTVNFQLNGSRNEVVELQLTDALGRPLVSKKINVNKGANAVSFNVPQVLARGSYLLRVVSPSGSVQKIIQKQ